MNQLAAPFTRDEGRLGIGIQLPKAEYLSPTKADAGLGPMYCDVSDERLRNA